MDGLARALLAKPDAIAAPLAGKGRDKARHQLNGVVRLVPNINTIALVVSLSGAKSLPLSAPFRQTNLPATQSNCSEIRVGLTSFLPPRYPVSKTWLPGLQHKNVKRSRAPTAASPRVQMPSKPESDVANLIVIHEAIKHGATEATQVIPLESSRRNEKRSPAERKTKPGETDGGFGDSGSKSKSIWPHLLPVKHEVENQAVAWKRRQSRFTCAQAKQRECAEESAACANRLQRITI